MASTKTLMNVMGVTFILLGIFFFVVGGMMIIVMGTVTSALASLGPTLSAFGAGSQLSAINSVVLLGWVFSFITFLAGILSIITAILLFVSKE